MRNCYRKGQRLAIEPFHLFAKSVALLSNLKYELCSAQVWRLARPCVASYGPSRCLLQPAQRPARRVNSRLTVPRVAFPCPADSPYASACLFFVFLVSSNWTFAFRIDSCRPRIRYRLFFTVSAAEAMRGSRGSPPSPSAATALSRHS